MMAWRVALAFLAALTSAPAWGQSRPSFDCTKASSAVEQTICGHADLGDADRAMAAAYAKLLATLQGPAREHLQADQARWLQTNLRLCDSSLQVALAASEIDSQRYDCLKSRIKSRMARLRDMPAGVDYPFVSDRSVIEAGKVGLYSYRFFALYPRFDGGAVDGALNARIEAQARKAVTEPRPTRDLGPPPAGTHWNVEIEYELRYPVRGLVTVATFRSDYLGGVHGNSEARAVLVEIASGRALALDDVLSRSAGWPALVTRLTIEELRRQFVGRPGDPETLNEVGIGKMLTDPARWFFGPEGVEIVFNPYEVGPYAAGAFEVALSYQQLRPVIRMDGPLAAKAR